MEKMWVLLFCLALLRFLFLLAPQTGYIHPDEFFQTVEIVAGRVLGVDTFTSWEYNSTFPIRSVSLPYLVAGLPLTFLNYTTYFSQTETPVTYFALVLPRLMMGVLSQMVDLSTFYLCVTFRLDAKYGWFLLSTSYVTLVFLTRTFTNSMETVLFSLLLVVLVKSSNFKSFQKKSDTTSQRIRQEKPSQTRKSNKISCEPHYLLWFILGVLIIFGLFNRPTFLLFIITPLLWWICFHGYQVYHTKQSTYMVSLILCVGSGIMFTFFVFVAVDTFYFNPDFLQNIGLCGIEGNMFLGCLKMIKSNMVITPWNFIQYNLKSENLAQHGLHPHYLHLVVNVPLLFGPIAFGVLYHLRQCVLGLYKKRFNWQSVLLLSCALVPVLLLSVFPHQEPRFLLPILPLMVIMSLGQKYRTHFKVVFLIAWITFNLFLSLVFGVLHQGGIIPCLQHIQSRIANETSPTRETALQTNITDPLAPTGDTDKYIFFHTYMPPRHLLLSNQINDNIIDLQGADRKTLRKYVKKFKDMQGQGKLIAPNTVRNIFLIVPGTLVDDVHASFKFRSTAQFPLHLSFEDPPSFNEVLSQLNQFIYFSSMVDFYDRLIYKMSLFLVMIK